MQNFPRINQHGCCVPASVALVRCLTEYSCQTFIIHTFAQDTEAHQKKKVMNTIEYTKTFVYDEIAACSEQWSVSEFQAFVVGLANTFPWSIVYADGYGELANILQRILSLLISSQVHSIQHNCSKTNVIPNRYVPIEFRKFINCRK